MEELEYNEANIDSKIQLLKDAARLTNAYIFIFNIILI